MKGLPETQLPENELARYFDPVNRALVSVRTNGTVWARSFLTVRWKLYATKKPEVEIEVWQMDRLAKFAALPIWCKRVKRLPTMNQIETWALGEFAMTPTGQKVEMDGSGSDGSPSWLKLLGFI